MSPPSKRMSVAEINTLLMGYKPSAKVLDKGTAMRFFTPTGAFGFGDGNKLYRAYQAHLKRIRKRLPPGLKSFIDRVPSLHDARFLSGEYDIAHGRLTLRLSCWHYRNRNRDYVGRFTYKGCRLSADQLRGIKHILECDQYHISDGEVDLSGREERKFVHRLLCGRGPGRFHEIILDCSDLDFVQERKGKPTDFPGKLRISGMTPKEVPAFEAKYEGERLEELYDAMGRNVIGPDAYRELFEVKDVGFVPPLPPIMTPEFLDQLCPLTMDGRTIGETHRLVFVPSALDGQDFTLDLLMQKTSLAVKRLNRNPVFWAGQLDEWRKNGPVRTAALSLGEWILVPENDLPNSIWKTDGEQVKLLEHTNYRTARVLELTTMLVMNELQNHERLGSLFQSRCEDRREQGCRGAKLLPFMRGRKVERELRVCIERSSDMGVSFSDRFDHDAAEILSRAVVWKFDPS